MMITNQEIFILAQAIVNYRELWEDFLIDTNDGRWNRKEVEDNITLCETILGLR